MLRFGFLLAVSLATALPSTSAFADTLLIDSAQSAAATARPAHGASMDQVLQRFGEPQQRLGPVGEPPISRWVYEDFTTYFEGDTVIHSVLRFTPKVPQPEP